MLTIIRSTRVEWCDCDPARIIFYPRYFDMFETSTTVLIERALGMAKIDYLEAYDFIGHPAVEARARFRFPTRFGDDISMKTTLTAVEQSRFTLEHRVTKAGKLVVEGFETRQWVGRDAADPARLVSRPIPPDVLARLSKTQYPGGGLPRKAGERKITLHRHPHHGETPSMRIDAYTHFFPKKFYDMLNDVAADYKDMGKRVRSLPALYDLDVRKKIVDGHKDYQQILSYPQPAIEKFAKIGRRHRRCSAA